MTFLSFVFILTSLVTFVAGQLFLKRAMEASTKRRRVHGNSGLPRLAGIFLMTISFFLTLGLLQRFDLSYIYPFQGLSVIIITFAAAICAAGKTHARSYDHRRGVDQCRDRPGLNQLEKIGQSASNARRLIFVAASKSRAGNFG